MIKPLQFYKKSIGSMYYAEFDNIQIIGGDDKNRVIC